MTKDENAANAETKVAIAPEKEKSSGRQRGQKKEKVKPPTKIIIRHLPPTMSEEEFLKQIDPLPPHDFYYYAAADWSLGYDATCRAYITLKHYDDVFLFRDQFDGYVFVDSKGAEYPAIVEFAPFQGLLKNKSRRTDNKVNSIEHESHYQQFLAKLEEDREAAAKGNGECKLEFTLDRKKEEKITSTPLLQYLANKKEKRREEAKKRTEEKRRQRDEEKEKRRLSQQQHVTKIITAQDAGGKRGGDNKAAGNKDNASGEKREPVQEERMNSRAKRRAERDQRRREEHEQRKKEREREHKEKGGGKATENSANSEAANKEGTKSVDGNKDKPSDGRQQQQSQRKDVKKYSEQRGERDRKRNRERKDAPVVDAFVVDVWKPISKSDKDEKKKKEKEQQENEKNEDSTEMKADKIESKKEQEISDSVKNFIRSIASAKEFVPKHKQQEHENIETKLEDVDKSSATLECELRLVSKKLSDVTLSDNIQKNSEFANEVCSSDIKSNSKLLDEKQLQRQRSAEERRIRNKDRPSIAIYQPKSRMRLSEESDSNAGCSKDAPLRSNPTSDCESVKKEEQRVGTKKVSRYSERRSERRAANKEKQKSSDGDADNSFAGNAELQQSKSCENIESSKDEELD